MVGRKRVVRYDHEGHKQGGGVVGGVLQGFAVLALLVGVVWIFGGVALRVGGLLAVTAGLVVLAAGARMWFAVALTVAGVVAWGFGHAHFRARHGFWS